MPGPLNQHAYSYCWKPFMTHRAVLEAFLKRAPLVLPSWDLLYHPREVVIPRGALFYTGRCVTRLWMSSDVERARGRPLSHFSLSCLLCQNVNTAFTHPAAVSYVRSLTTTANGRGARYTSAAYRATACYTYPILLLLLLLLLLLILLLIITIPGI